MVDRISLVKQFLNLRSDNNIQIGLGLNSTRGVLSNAGVKAFILSAELVGYQVTSVFFQNPSEIVLNIFLKIRIRLAILVILTILATMAIFATMAILAISAIWLFLATLAIFSYFWLMPANIGYFGYF